MFDYWFDEETLEGGSLSEMLGVGPSIVAFSLDRRGCFLISFSRCQEIEVMIQRLYLSHLVFCKLISSASTRVASLDISHLRVRPSAILLLWSILRSSNIFGPRNLLIKPINFLKPLFFWRKAALLH